MFNIVGYLLDTFITITQRIEIVQIYYYIPRIWKKIHFETWSHVEEIAIDCHRYMMFINHQPIY
jgi:hypothetical protein